MTNDCEKIREISMREEGRWVWAHLAAALGLTIVLAGLLDLLF